MKARNSISCTLTTTIQVKIPEETEMIWGSHLMINIIFMRCLSAHMNSESNFNFILLRPPSKRRRGAQNKTKPKVKWRKKRKIQCLKFFWFLVAHMYGYMLISVCAWITCIFCRFIFHKHIAFLGAAFYEFIGAASWLMMAYGTETTLPSLPPIQSKTILFARDWRLFFCLAA